MITAPLDRPIDDAGLGKLAALAGVREFPVRDQVREPGVAHAESGSRGIESAGEDGIAGKLGSREARKLGSRKTRRTGAAHPQEHRCRDRRRGACRGAGHLRRTGARAPGDDGSDGRRRRTRLGVGRSEHFTVRTDRIRRGLLLAVQSRRAADTPDDASVGPRLPSFLAS